jgi:sugar phosphate isomerase/epimerase
LSNRRASPSRLAWADCYNAAMTLVEITYELQSPLTEEQLRHLGEFANTYGLRRFRLNEAKNQLSFEYDASRLRDTQVVHALGQARIAVARRIN